MKKICVFFLALAVFLLPEMVYAANATPQAVNMPHVYIVFGVLFVAAVLFFTEWIPLAVTSILVPCALSTLGVITVKEAWVSFGDTSILTIVGLFMLGEATFATGFAQRVATSIINKNPPAGLLHSSHRLHVGLFEQCWRHGHHPAHAHFHRPQGPLVPLAHLAAHGLRGQLRRLYLACGAGSKHGG